MNKSFYLFYHNMKYFGILLIFFISNSFILANPIENISLIDNISNPLKNGDNGITFSYRTDECGIINASLSFKEVSYKIISEKKELRGNGRIILLSKRLHSWFGCDTKNNNQTFSLIINHNSCRTSKYKNKKLPLIFKIEAPYGCSLLDNPTSPTDKIKTIKPLSVLEILSGVGLCILGINTVSKKNPDNTSVEDISSGLLIGGIVLFTIGFSDLYQYVPDKQKIREWKKQCRETDKKNRLIKDTYKIKFIDNK